ncbi:hypothetical protein SPI_03619 [Niveomyces insectorum RCEF 264]|uniref:Uncharacterized protein n=1 Tax=Niveomyces insectorum RCEF 264 TaxID=1081102 RepID=A0A167W866_9HYPO|nr:hypothetical protein SPI_03619 [Niveomyces insectorum RCEF 264]
MCLRTYLGLVCLWACSVLSSPTTLDARTNTPALRYVPGTALQASANIAYDPDGVFVLGVDGVLRTFAPNISVVDYRQLDPAQVNELAVRLATHSEFLGVELAPGLQYLLDHPETDGRSVVNTHDLLQPTNPLVLPDPAYSNSTSPPQKRDLTGLLDPRQPALCPGTCASVSDCVFISCFACYFPYGPGSIGLCFTN